MNIKMPALRPLLLVLLLSFCVVPLNAEIPELSIRGALPNTQKKLQSKEDIRVAFLGGSITAAEGWRVHTLDILQKLYPSSNFHEIFAAVPGTGSDYGAARLGRDVLRHKPDLIFVEFAVNDINSPPQYVLAQMEGIVRQAWRQMPDVDFCFVYTVNQRMIESIRKGELPGSVKAMERVAMHYGIPSIQFGSEVARRMNKDTLVFYAPSTVAADTNGKDPKGRLIFSRDKTHPTPAGHLVYAKVIERTLPEILAHTEQKTRDLPASITPDNWQNATFVEVSEKQSSKQWERLSPENPIRQKAGRMAPPVWRTLSPGASIEFKFKGTRVGFIGLKSADSGQFNCYIDGKKVATDTLFDSYSTPGRHVLRPWFFKEALPDTEHHVRIELTSGKIDKLGIMGAKKKPLNNPEAYAGNNLYFCGFLIVGSPLTPPHMPE